jgi:hypothetical protein
MMGRKQGQADVFTIVSILTLCFLALGIALAIFQWRGYAQPVQPGDVRLPRGRGLDVELLKPAPGTGAETGPKELGGDTGTPPREAPPGAPAGGGPDLP